MKGVNAPDPEALGIQTESNPKFSPQALNRRRSMAVRLPSSSVAIDVSWRSSQRPPVHADRQYLAPGRRAFGCVPILTAVDK